MRPTIRSEKFPGLDRFKGKIIEEIVVESGYGIVGIKLNDGFSFELEFNIDYDDCDYIAIKKDGKTFEWWKPEQTRVD